MATQTLKSTAASYRLEGKVAIITGGDQGITNVFESFGTADILVNNAGLERLADFCDVTEHDYDLVLSVNLKGVFFTTQTVVRHWLAAKQRGKTSGRPPLGMKMLVDPLGLTEPIAAFNGGVFVQPDLSVMTQSFIPSDIATKVIDAIEHHQLDCWVYTDRDWLVRDTNAPHVAREQWTVKFPPIVVRDFVAHLERIAKIVGVSDDYSAVAHCEADVQRECGNHVSAARSQPYYLDVTHPDANKGHVVEVLSQVLSAPSSQIATMGDMPNDVLMFKKSGLSIAMGNASPEVQRQALCVTTSNQEEGFAKAVETFILGAHQEVAEKAS